LEASAAAFDAGEEWELAWMATAIRVLAYDRGNRQRSVVEQLGLKATLDWLHTVIDTVLMQGVISGWFSSLASLDVAHARFVPLLHVPTPHPTIFKPFGPWWKKTVFSTRFRQNLSRASNRTPAPGRRLQLPGLLPESLP
jgi:hypothetical protein